LWPDAQDLERASRSRRDRDFRPFLIANPPEIR
jgi:hypothetical protein